MPEDIKYPNPAAKRCATRLRGPISYSRKPKHVERHGGCEAGKPDFWINNAGANTPPIHVAFRVGTRAEVDAFHAAGLAAGGTDNGAPGIRAHYHPNYYGAFVRCPDGHNIEAVCHAPA